MGDLNEAQRYALDLVATNPKVILLGSVPLAVITDLLDFGYLGLQWDGDCGCSNWYVTPAGLRSLPAPAPSPAERGTGSARSLSQIRNTLLRRTLALLALPFVVMLLIPLGAAIGVIDAIRDLVGAFPRSLAWAAISTAHTDARPLHRGQGLGQ